MEKKPFYMVEWMAGDLNALVKNLGEQNARDVAAGRVTIERINDSTLQLKDKQDKPVTLFDKNGFRIKPQGLKAKVTKPNTDYYFDVRTSNANERLVRISQYLGIEPFIQAVEFSDRFSAIIERIVNDETTAKLLKGTWLPFALPQMSISWSFAGKPIVNIEGSMDYGTVLDEKFLPAVEASYRAQFPQRSFTNYRKGELAEQVTIVEGSRHEQLVEAMRQGVVVGVYFPSALQGFSVLADREQMSSLPQQFLLAGALEAAACYIASPDMLARDGKTPLLDLAALQWRSGQYSLCFYAYDDGASFDDRAALGVAYGNCAGGLVVLG